MLERLTSALGAVVMLGLAFAMCPRERWRHVNRRTVLGGLALTLLVAGLVLGTPVSRLFGALSAGVERLLGFTRQGAGFVFGGLANDAQSFGYVFAFQVLPTILFFSALMSALHHMGCCPGSSSAAGAFCPRASASAAPRAFRR